MKCLSLFFAFSAALLPLSAAETQPLPEKNTLQHIRCSDMTEEREKTIQSVKLIYSVTGTKTQQGFLMLRARRYDQVRVDFLQDGEHLCACRDGSQFWVYNAKEGKISMTPEEARDFTRFAAFLAVSFQKETVFSEPVRVGEELVNGVPRTVFEVKAMDGSGIGCKLSVENSTGDLRKVKKSGPDDGTARVVFYWNYRVVDGIRIPGNIDVSRVHSHFNLTLTDAEWNMIPDNAVFRRNGDINDPDMVLLKQRKGAVKPAPAAPRRNSNAVFLENRARQLRLEIEDCEGRLAKLDGAMAENRRDAMTLATTSGTSHRHYYWGGSCWGGSRRESNTRRRMAKKLGKENDRLDSEYRMLSDRLLQLRTDLSETEFALKQFQGK